MLQPHQLIAKARTSSFYLWVLNIALARIIPFNAPHKPKIQRITSEELEITLPYIRKNLNHLKGLHACALAALSEFACGLMLISKFPGGEYRLIMKELKMTYHYQGRTAAITRFSIPENVIASTINELKNAESVFKTFNVETYDKQGNHLCTGAVTWQLKNWKAVRSK